MSAADRSAPALAQVLLDECAGDVDIALLHLIDEQYGQVDLLDACSGDRVLAATTLVMVARGVFGR
jgi:hypothetical protein